MLEQLDELVCVEVEAVPNLLCLLPVEPPAIELALNLDASEKAASAESSGRLDLDRATLLR